MYHYFVSYTIPMPFTTGNVDVHRDAPIRSIEDVREIEGGLGRRHGAQVIITNWIEFPPTAG